MTKKAALALCLDQVEVSYASTQAAARSNDSDASDTNRAALSRVSLQMEVGAQVALIGMSGAGKTTLLNLLNGMQQPTHGSVTVFGQNLEQLTASQLRQVRTDIGFVHQQFSLQPSFSVLQNVLTGRLGKRRLLGSLRDAFWPAAELVDQVYQLLEQLGIANTLYRRSDRLSGGQQQRVAIARALFQQPQLLLADEPIASVDPQRGKAVLDLLQDQCKQRGITLLTSLHNLELAQSTFPRLVALRHGEIGFDGPSDQFSAQHLALTFRSDHPHHQ